ncbi:hypothetical protein BDL97_02G188500 [Sphagnum fallax]|nr:hypothetical protein BDL97_02G188500 [Sphagnum fallax]
MDGFFQSLQVGDLALGKPAVRRLSTTATVGEALELLKKAHEPYLGLWAHKKHVIGPRAAAAADSSSSSVNSLIIFGNGTTTTTLRKPAAIREEDLDHPNERNSSNSGRRWQCVGRVSMIEMICFLARDESLMNLPAALNTPLSVFVSPTSSSAVHHVDSRTWLFEALEGFLDGTQHLVVPIDCSSSIASDHMMLNSCYHRSSSIPANMISKLGGATTTTTTAVSTLGRNINVQLPQSNSCDGLTRHFCINSNASQSNIMAASAFKSESCEILREEYCWLAPEDVVRFLLSCIGLFSPIPMMSIQQLGLINTEVLIARATANAMSTLPLIQKAAREMTAVAVIEDDDDDLLNSDGELTLVGDISAFTMKGCNETAALALATLSVRDFLSYAQDCGGPPNSLVQLVQLRVQEKIDTATKFLSKQTMASLPTNSPTHQHHQCHHHHYYSSMSKDDSQVCPSSFSLVEAFHGLETAGSEESSDEDLSPSALSPDGPLSTISLLGSSSSSAQTSLYKLQQCAYSKGRMAPHTCRPWSSLVAVMAQALTHRVGYIWVTDERNSLLGIVTYLDIIKCLLNNLYEPFSQ